MSFSISIDDDLCWLQCFPFCRWYHHHMCFLFYGISDFISIYVNYILVYRISYGLLYYQDYVPNIALTTVNDFLLKILRHYLHFFLLLLCCDAYKSRSAKTYIKIIKNFVLMKLKVFHKCFLHHGNAIDLENSFLNRILRTFQKRGFKTISRDNFGSY